MSAEMGVLAHVRVRDYEGFAIIAEGHLDADAQDRIARAEFRGERVGCEHVCWVRQRRVMWCERYGDPCDENGEWHTHWHEVIDNGDPRCRFTVIYPLSDPPAQSPSGGDA